MHDALLIIDGQCDFGHPVIGKDALYVAGDPDNPVDYPSGDFACKNIANFIRKMKKEIPVLGFTLDTHHRYAIYHPRWWVDKNGNFPAPFTKITHAEVMAGEWRTALPHFQTVAAARRVGVEIEYGAEEYLKALEEKGRFIHTVWPEHCILGTPGHALHPEIIEAAREWEYAWKRNAEKTIKASNPTVEQFSAFEAEVVVAGDPTTQYNFNFLNIFMNDQIRHLYVGGIAKSYCLGLSLDSMLRNFSAEQMKRIVLINGMWADIPGENPLAEQVWKNLIDADMQTAEITDFL